MTDKKKTFIEWLDHFDNSRYRVTKIQDISRKEEIKKMLKLINKTGTIINKKAII